MVKPDPITTHGQSPWGASEGEGRLSTATSAAYQVLLKYEYAKINSTQALHRDPYTKISKQRLVHKGKDLEQYADC